MFGISEYLMAGAVAATVASAGIAGVQTIRMQQFKAERLEALHEVAMVRGALDTCANRLINREEAAESNASIPDDLSDFDPTRWLLPESGSDPTTD